MQYKGLALYKGNTKDGIVLCVCVCVCVCGIQPVVLRKHTGRERKSTVLREHGDGNELPWPGTKLIMSRDDRGRNGPRKRSLVSRDLELTEREGGWG